MIHLHTRDDQARLRSTQCEDDSDASRTVRHVFLQQKHGAHSEGLTRMSSRQIREHTKGRYDVHDAPDDDNELDDAILYFRQSSRARS